MENVFRSVTQMSEDFYKRMAEFEAKLQKDAGAPASIAGLTTEFTSFKLFTIQSLNSLQEQLQFIARSVDNLEMRGRRKILLLHGVAEDKKENLPDVIVNVINDKFKVHNLFTKDIKRCQRLGRTVSTEKPRPILFKIQDVGVRDKIWFSKSKLKGSGITMSEFLTRARHEVFMAAREKIGINNCWTKEGNVFVMSPDGKRQRVTTLVELNRVLEIAEKPTVASKAPTAKTKRAPATKK